MKENIHIVCNIDNNYIQHCCTMLVSLFENNKREKFNIHIISDDLNSENKEDITSVVNEFNNTVSYYNIPVHLIKDCPTDEDSHISIAAVYRCFLSSILPLEIRKVIYLDCDLIVTGSIFELWNMDISNYALGCVEDMWSDKDEIYTRLNYDKKYSYFNSGVLLVNLDYWREHKVEKEFIKFIAMNNRNLLFVDQDVLNGVLHGKTLFISFKWNMQDGFFRYKRKIRKEVWKELDELIQTPAIIHYTGSKKPWHYKSQHPYKEEYFKAFDKTKWKGWRPKGDIKTIFIKNINQFLYFCKLIKPKYKRING